MKYTLLLLLLSTIYLNCINAYRPVVLMHGINSDAGSMESVKDWIEQALPGIYVLNVEIGNGATDSIFMTMNSQVEIFNQVVNSDPNLVDGFNIVCFSQGTLVARGFLERYNSPKVHNYIGWNGPQAGVFGIPIVNIKWIDAILNEVPYESWAQDHISAANYWRDPYNIPAYLEDSQYLADLNNERVVKNQTYKDNILSLNAMILSYSIVDTTIWPAQSGWFGFYAPGSQSVIVPLQGSQLYLQDYIGLKTLDETGRLHFFTTDCKHVDHPTESCKPYFTNFTLPWITN